MKRVKGKELVILSIIIILLTGCAPKIECKANAIVDSHKYTSAIVVSFENNKPLKYVFKDKMMFDPDDPNAELYYHAKYEEYGTLIAEKRAKMSNNTDNISLKIKYNFSKYHSAQEDKILIDRDDSMEDVKNKLESVGYSCK